MLERDYPEEGDLVMCSVKEVFPYGAFVILDEYDKEGMIHIKEISSSWVKNIRNHVREGQKIVCKVLKVDASKNHIDLSLRRVTSQQKKTKVQEFKREKKGEKLLELYASNIGEDYKSIIHSIGVPIVNKYGDLYAAFEETSTKGKSVLEGLIDEKYVDGLYEIIKTNVENPLVSITGHIILECFSGDGVNIVKDALINAREKYKDKVENVEIRNEGSPKYSVHIVAEDYKAAESVLRDIAEMAISHVQSNEGKGSFKRS